MKIENNHEIISSKGIEGSFWLNLIQIMLSIFLNLKKRQIEIEIVGYFIFLSFITLWILYQD